MPPEIKIDANVQKAWSHNITRQMPEAEKIELSVDMIKKMIGTGKSKNKGFVRFVRGFDENGNETVTIDKIGNKISLPLSWFHNLDSQKNQLLRDAVAEALGKGARYMSNADVAALRQVLGSTKIGLDSHEDNVAIEQNANRTLKQKLTSFVAKTIKGLRKGVTFGVAAYGVARGAIKGGVSGAATALAKNVGLIALDHFVDKFQAAREKHENILSRDEVKKAYEIFTTCFATPAGRIHSATIMMEKLAEELHLDGLGTAKLAEGAEGAFLARAHKLIATLSPMAAEEKDGTGPARQALKALGELVTASQGGEDLAPEKFIALLRDCEEKLRAPVRTAVLQQMVVKEVNDAAEEKKDLKTSLNPNAKDIAADLIEASDGPSTIAGLEGTEGLKGHLFAHAVLPTLMDAVLKQVQILQMTTLDGSDRVPKEVIDAYMKRLAATEISSFATRFKTKMDVDPDVTAAAAQLVESGENATEDQMKTLLAAVEGFTKRFVADNVNEMTQSAEKATRNTLQNQADQLRVRGYLNVVTSEGKLGEMTETSFRKALDKASVRYAKDTMEFTSGDQGVADSAVKTAVDTYYLPRLVQATLKEVVDKSIAGKMDETRTRQALFEATQTAAAKLEAVYKAFASKQSDFVGQAMGPARRILDYAAQHKALVKTGQIDDKTRIENDLIFKAVGRYGELLNKISGIPPSLDPVGITTAYGRTVKLAVEAAATDLRGMAVAAIIDNDKLVNELAPPAEYTTLVGNLVDYHVTNNLPKDERAGYGVLPSTETLKGAFQKRFMALWQEATAGTNMRGHSTLVAWILEHVPFLNSDNPLSLDGEWMKKVKEKFATSVTAETTAYFTYEKAVGVACREMIGTAVKQAVSKDVSKNVPEDIRKELTERVFKQYATALNGHLTDVLNNVGGGRLSELTKDPGADAEKILASLGKDALTLDAVVENVINEAKNAVRDAIDEGDVRIGFRANGYTLAIWSSTLAGKKGFFEDLQARSSFSAQTSDGQPVFTEREKVALGDLGTSKALARVQENPLLFIGTTKQAIQEGILLKAADETKPIADQYRTIRASFNKTLDALAKADEFSSAAPEILARARDVVTDRFTLRLRELDKAGLTLDDFAKEFTAETVRPLFAALVRDLQGGIVHKSYADYEAVNTIEKNLTERFNKAYPEGYLAPELATKMRALGLKESDKTWDLMVNACRKYRDRFALDLRRYANEIHAREHDATAAERAKLVEEMIGAMKLPYELLERLFAAKTQALDFPVEEQLGLAEEKYLAATGRKLFDGPGATQLKARLTAFYTDQMKSGGWQAQYDAVLASLVADLDTQRPLAADDVNKIVGPFRTTTVQTGLLSDILSDYNDELGKFREALTRMVTEKGLGEVAVKTLRVLFDTHVATGLRSYVAQFTDVGSAGSPRSLKQLLDDDFWQTFQGMVKSAFKANALTLDAKLTDGCRTCLYGAFEKQAESFGLPKFDALKLFNHDNLPLLERAFYRICAEAVKTQEESVKGYFEREEVLSGTNFAELCSDMRALIANNAGPIVQNACNSLNAEISAIKTVVGDCCNRALAAVKNAHMSRGFLPGTRRIYDRLFSNDDKDLVNLDRLTARIIGEFLASAGPDALPTDEAHRVSEADQAKLQSLFQDKLVEILSASEIDRALLAQQY